MRDFLLAAPIALFIIFLALSFTATTNYLLSGGYAPEPRWRHAPEPRWRHVKRGTTYTELGRGKYHTAVWSNELGDIPVVIYRADVDGTLWVRPEFEFMDGRFERVTP